MMNKREKSILISLGLGQLTLMTAALLSIKSRASYEIRGKKIWWMLLSLFNYVGPITYFIFGRTTPGIKKKFEV